MSLKNKLKLIKRIAVIILILILGIETFAAVVSDNDGSAFVTKSEFESLKNNFSNQIGQYNTSIDNKIDGAIASYLAGMRLDKVVRINSLLTSDGKYGGYEEYWSSATNLSFDTKQIKYSRDTWEMVHNLGRYSMAVQLEEPQYNDWTDYERDYWTSKKTKLKLETGEDVIAFERMKITSKMKISIWESKAYVINPATTAGSQDDTTFEWQPSSPTNAIDNNRADIHQNKTNIHCNAYGRLYNVSPNFNTNVGGKNIESAYNWSNWGCISTSTGEVTYKYDKENLNCPLSNATDYYWDPEDETSYPTSDIKENANSTHCKNRSSIETIKRGFWKGPSGNDEIKWQTISPQIYFQNTTPWTCTAGISARDAYLKHWISTSPKNRQVKNGMHIATTDANGKLTIVANADAAGKLYVYIGDKGTVIDNWTASSFEGSKFDLEANVSKKCEIENVKKEKCVWVIYLPTNVNDIALLKIEDIYETLEG